MKFRHAAALALMGWFPAFCYTKRACTIKATHCWLVA